jgi:hypothetical protein
MFRSSESHFLKTPYAVRTMPTWANPLNSRCKNRLAARVRSSNRSVLICIGFLSHGPNGVLNSDAGWQKFRHFDTSASASPARNPTGI